jgi:hypothetical protein
MLCFTEIWVHVRSSVYGLQYIGWGYIAILKFMMQPRKEIADENTTVKKLLRY